MSELIDEPESESAFEKLRKDRQREVVRLSLELLSNTKHYKKYIAKKTPRRTTENEQTTKNDAFMASSLEHTMPTYHKRREGQTLVFPSGTLIP